MIRGSRNTQQWFIVGGGSAQGSPKISNTLVGPGAYEVLAGQLEKKNSFNTGSVPFGTC